MQKNAKALDLGNSRVVGYTSHNKGYVKGNELINYFMKKGDLAGQPLFLIELTKAKKNQLL